MQNTTGTDMDAVIPGTVQQGFLLKIHVTCVPWQLHKNLSAGTSVLAL